MKYFSNMPFHLMSILAFGTLSCYYYYHYDANT